MNDVLTCSHPFDKIKVVFIVSRPNGRGYHVETPIARCRQCRVTLEPTDKKAIAAIDLIFIKLEEKRKRVNTKFHINRNS